MSDINITKITEQKILQNIFVRMKVDFNVFENLDIAIKTRNQSEEEILMYL